MNLRKRPPARTRLTWTLGLLVALVAAGCAPAGQAGGQVCAARRLEVSRSLYEVAREGMARYFRQREDFALTEAYLASQDATVLARASRGCWDFDELSRRQAIDLIKANLLFQKLVVANMRDQDPGVVIDLYGREYREIFRSDLH
jgi:hypothetical protein